MSRIRIIAGPNGSGKSSVFDLVKNYKNPQNKLIKMGPFINADQLEQDFRISGCVNLAEFKINKPPINLLTEYLKTTSIAGKYDPSIATRELEVNGSKLIVLNPEKISKEVYSLMGMVVSELIREELLKMGESFTMETVFSHPSKIEFISRASEKGFKVYLYFVSTNGPELNIERVKGRVASGGHNVPVDKIRDRYYKTMENLKPALMRCYRGYIYDNSSSETSLIAVMDKDKNIEIIAKTIPGWFNKYILNAQ